MEQLVGSVCVGQPGHEPGTVQIRIGTGLKVGRGSLGFESDNIVDVGVVMDHGAKHHFIPAAHGASQSARHPRFHEGRDPFVKPARGIVPGAGHRTIENGNRIVVGRHNLAEEQRAKAAIRGIRVVAHHDVDGLVIHDPGHAFVGRQRFVGVAEGSDADVDEVRRHRSRGAVAVVAEIFEQYARLLRRGVVE